MVHFTERRLSSIVQQSQDGTTLFSPGFAGKMLIVTKWPGDIIRQTDGLVCVESVSLPPTFSYSRWRMNCENNERIYDHKLENLSSEMQTSHLFRGEEGGGRPETKNWPSHGREEQINSQREERLFTARLTSKLRCSTAPG